MAAIIIPTPIHCHDFKESTNNEEEMPTNDSVDELSRPQLSPMTKEEGGDNNNDNNKNEDDDEATVIHESPSSETTASSTDSFCFTPSNDSSSSTTITQYGGLNNMGNTCYLNSALQMLASLDDFGDSLKQVPYDSKLRESLVDVLTRLRNGETVRPSEFKNVIDERSSLFIGYRQQDAHEFLTTLLDLLDEDYKKATERKSDDDDENEEDAKTEATEEEKDNAEPVVSDDEMENDDSKTETVDSNHHTDDNDVAVEADVVPELVADDETMDENEESCMEAEPVDISEPISRDEEVDAETEDQEVGRSIHDSEDLDDDSYVVVEREEVEEREEDGRSSPFKKQKTEDSGYPTEDDEESNTISSFMNLQFSDIESLLHGDKEAPQTPASPSKEEEPKYKLVGGRMSTAGVQLTPFENSGSNMNREETPVPSKPSRPEAPSDDDTPKQSPIDQSFATEVRVCLTCDSCKYRRSHTEKYLHLSLEIGDDCSSIEDGIRKFFAPEKREIKCEKCFYETAMQTTEITRLPRAMLFHLKRFIVNISPDYTSISYSKDQSPVSFEEGLAFGADSVLSEFLADDVALPEGSACYGIRSVVNHIGSSASCGHYTADGRRRYDSTGRQWTRFNDSMVCKITDREAVEDSSRTAYMVMYEVGA